MQRSRPFQYKATPDLVLAKCEMAGTRIKDDIDTTLGQFVTRPIANPGIFTDFKSNTNTAAIKNQVAERILATSHGGRRLGVFPPGFKPAWFVV